MPTRDGTLVPLANTIEPVLHLAHPTPQLNHKSTGSAVFAQVTAVSLYFTMGAPFPQNCPFPRGIWTPSNTIPWAHRSPQTKRHLYRFSHFCTDDCRVSLYFIMGRPFSPQNCHFQWGDLDPHLIHGSLSPPESSTQMASRSVQPF